VTFTINEITVVFAIARIIAYGKGYTIPTLVSIDSDDEPTNKIKSIEVQTSPNETKSPIKEEPKMERENSLKQS
jgi:hypothetical protein